MGSNDFRSTKRNILWTALRYPDGAGILVPTRDPRALADAIQQVLRDGREIAKMGAVGRQRVEQLFTWKRVAERTVEVYKELL
jgi:glycosyltransferase involved in cell wall biosynthesis